jgi:uncharacterized protein (DUF4415 family)
MASPSWIDGKSPGFPAKPKELAKLQAEVARGKTRITILIDNEVLSAFRARAEGEGTGYQTLINSALRAAIAPEAAPVTMESLRQVLREELLAR